MEIRSGEERRKGKENRFYRGGGVLEGRSGYRDEKGEEKEVRLWRGGMEDFAKNLVG